MLFCSPKLLLNLPFLKWLHLCVCLFHTNTYDLDATLRFRKSNNNGGPFLALFPYSVVFFVGLKSFPMPLQASD